MDSGSTLRVEKAPSLKSVTRKTYVLDTNVLLHDPMAVTAFKQHHVVIPMTVLEELDHIKDRHDKTVSREARIAIQMIDKVVDNASPHEIQEGVAIPGTGLDGLPQGTLAIYADQRLGANSEVHYLDDTADHADDNRIINVALRLQSENGMKLLSTGEDQWFVLPPLDRVAVEPLRVELMLRFDDARAAAERAAVKITALHARLAVQTRSGHATDKGA